MAIRFTGHPLADVGVATLCAMAGAAEPAELTSDDLDRVAKELHREYFSGRMQSYLTCVFMNSEYVQHGSGKAKDQKRAEYSDRVLRAYRWVMEGRVEDDARGLLCAFSGEPATHLVHRSQIPMFTGADVLNFLPGGRGALAVAGQYLTAIQAIPMGGRRAEGRLLIAHADDPALTIAFARRYVEDNRRLLDLARRGRLPAANGPDPVLEREHGAKGQAGEDGGAPAKYPDAKGPLSLVAADLLDLSLERLELRPESSITVYVMSNSGQGPSLAMHPIPSNLVRFLRRVNQADTARSWRALVARAWRDPAAKDEEQKRKAGRSKPRRRGATPPRRGADRTTPGGPGRSRNAVLDELFPIFDAGITDSRAAMRFARRHLLCHIGWSAGERRPAAIGGAIEPTLIDWKLTSLFLEEVLGMDAKRVERIRQFSDRLADHIAGANDVGLFRDVVFGRRPWEIRNALTKAQRNEAREHDRLLFGLQDYLDVFEADDAVGLADWSLTRDLVSIRLVETLQERGFFRGRPESLDAPSAEDESRQR